mmetsp:Transcript_8066/g.13571  ORF Transcript_8066/g.13571 Transcript_8066/m.13571 type:complete len:326 (+) Transcript_8066:280-1257(+)
MLTFSERIETVPRLPGLPPFPSTPSSSSSEYPSKPPSSSSPSWPSGCVASAAAGVTVAAVSDGGDDNARGGATTPVNSWSKVAASLMATVPRRPLPQPPWSSSSSEYPGPSSSSSSPPSFPPTGPGKSTFSAAAAAAAVEATTSTTQTAMRRRLLKEAAVCRLLLLLVLIPGLDWTPRGGSTVEWSERTTCPKKSSRNCGGKQNSSSNKCLRPWKGVGCRPRLARWRVQRSTQLVLSEIACSRLSATRPPQGPSNSTEPTRRSWRWWGRRTQKAWRTSGAPSRIQHPKKKATALLPTAVKQQQQQATTVRTKRRRKEWRTSRGLL